MDLRKKFGKVALLMGGDSPEREVSLRSGRAVAQALTELGIDKVEIDATSWDLVECLKAHRPDRCLIMLHGEAGENGGVQALLKLLRIPYSGSDMSACALSMDKLLAKEIWQGKGLKTPNFSVLDDALSITGLGFPLVVKPVDGGSSVGVSKVESVNTLKMAYHLAKKSYGSVMAEKWIEGDEFTVSIVGDVVLPSIRIEAPDTFYDYDAKYVTGSRYHCPSGVDEKTEQQLKSIALAAYHSLGCRGWARVDFIQEAKTGALFLIELNTVPGMTNLSLVPQAAKVYGWDFNTLVLKILESAL